MALYRVMGRGETNEESCFQNDLSRDAAEGWISRNEDNYPETRFWVEKQEEFSIYDEEYEEGELE